jgi:beta-phosphoglucomutase-like phosphatase (HAD superfamily)
MGLMLILSKLKPGDCLVVEDAVSGLDAGKLKSNI